MKWSATPPLKNFGISSDRLLIGGFALPPRIDKKLLMYAKGTIRRGLRVTDSRCGADVSFSRSERTSMSLWNDSPGGGWITR